MAKEKRQIFREQSLEKLSSPDRLDQLLRIVRPHVWLMLFGVGTGLVLAIVWSILGRIPETASGTAILVKPKQVVYFESPGSGQIETIAVRVGDRVDKGDLLAKLSLPTLEADLEQEQAKLERLQGRVGEMSELEKKAVEEQLRHIERRRTLIHEQQESIRTSADEYRDNNAKYVEQQRSNLRERRRLAEEVGDLYQERLRAYEDLEDEGLSSRDRLVEARRQVVENELNLAGLDVLEESLNLRENDARRDYQQELDRVRDLEIELSALDLEALKLQQSLREGELDNEAEVEEVESRIELLQAKLTNEGLLYSNYSGTVLEVSITPGTQVGIGQRLGRLEAEDENAELKALTYFSIKDGKKLQPGLEMRVSPANVEKERFGGIVGKVESVSDYPVTSDSVANQIGDPEIAKTLLGGQSRIGVTAALAPEDTFTGFEWTSGRGPEDFKITAGTTAEVRVTIRERRPITVLLPFLEKFEEGWTTLGDL